MIMAMLAFFFRLVLSLCFDVYDRGTATKRGGGAAEKKPRAIQMKSSEYSRQEAW